MAESPDPAAALTGPGAPFEMETVDVRGVPTRVFTRRLRSLRALAHLAAAKWADRELLVHGDHRITYGRFFELANSATTVLREDHGLGPGDRVALLAANHPTWAVTFWAALNANAVAVALNGWWKAEEIEYGLDDADPRVLVVDRDRLARIRGSLGERAGIEAVFVIDPAPGDLHGDDRLQDAAQLLTRPTTTFPDTPIDEDDPAVMLYTSGTTGRPKGAVATHRSWLASIHNVAGAAAVTAVSEEGDRPPSTRNDVRLLSVPLFHVSGSQAHLVSGLLAGWKLVMPEGRFDPGRVLELIEAEQVTAWAAVPTMVSRVCRHPDRHRRDLSTVRTIGYGGAPIPAGLADAVAETFPGVTHQSNIYGLTETSGVATMISGRERLARPGSTGRALLTVDVEIRDEQGRALPAGEAGEVCVRGPLLIAGYWNQPQATAEAIVDGWLHTGDVGHLDAEGYLYITDRAKDVIIRGGENVYCVEVEDRLVRHPDVIEAAVVGVPHPDLGEEVAAFVVEVPDAALAAADLRAWTAAALADFKVPSRFDIGPGPLPRNEAGKVLKRELRARVSSPP